jgi:hypothetical protein
MRQSFLLILLLVGCVAKNPEATEPASSLPTPAAVELDIEVADGESPPAKRFPDSTFLPAVIRAGLLEYEWEVVDAIELRGTIIVEDTDYFVLYVDRYLWLSSYNQRGGSYWLICDSALNPVWVNPDWGGTPGQSFENKIQVDLTDKFFEISEDNGYGDLLSFRRDEKRLVASIDWASDESRIAQALNWPKRRGPHGNRDYDEEVRQILPVAGHPTWRIVLTQYVNLYDQGCANLIDEDGHGEFGCSILSGLWSEQACSPCAVRTAFLPLSKKTVAWIDYETRSGRRWRSTIVFDGSTCREIASERLS